MSSSFLWVAELLGAITVPKTVGSKKSQGSLGQAWKGVFWTQLSSVP